MYKISELKTMLLFDIESLPTHWSVLSEELKKIWVEKFHYKCLEQEIDFQTKKFLIENKTENTTVNKAELKPNVNSTYESIYTKYAGLHPEFAKVWCFSFGLYNIKNELEINTLQNDNEKELLEEIIQVMNHYENYNLAGYNIAAFDIPFIITRMQVYGLNEKYPKQLQLRNAKPWTTTHIDFMLDWKSLRWESSSLDLVCAALGVASPKAKFANHEFTTLLTNGKITTAEGIFYCEGDVKALGECIVKCASDNCNYGGSDSPKTWSKKK